MKYVLRMFFYSLSLVLLIGAFGLDPATGQFHDMLALIHRAEFWRMVGVVAALLVGLDLLFGGKINIAVPTFALGQVGKAANKGE